MLAINNLFWMGSMNVQGQSVNKRQTRDLHAYGYIEPPRVEAAEAMELAASMADRFHRTFLRTLRALRDLRRYSPTIRVHNEGQMNIAAQQFNTTSHPVSDRS